jgi:hypothetical protein
MAKIVTANDVKLEHARVHFESKMRSRFAKNRNPGCDDQSSCTSEEHSLLILLDRYLGICGKVICRIMKLAVFTDICGGLSAATNP